MSKNKSNDSEPTKNAKKAASKASDAAKGYFGKAADALTSDTAVSIYKHTAIFVAGAALGKFIPIKNPWG